MTGATFIEKINQPNKPVAPSHAGNDFHA